MKKLIISITAVIILLVAFLPTAVLAAGPSSGNSTGTFTVGDIAPQVNSVQIYDSTGTTEVTSMTPQTQYMFKIDLTELNSLDHLTSMRVILFYYSGTPVFPTTSIPINADAAAGTSNIVVPASSIGGFAGGDNVQVKDTTHSEYKVVASVNSGTNTVVLTTPLQYSYTMAPVHATITDFNNLPTVANSQNCANFNWVKTGSVAGGNADSSWSSTYPPASGDTGATTWASGTFTRPTDFTQSNFVFTGQFTPGKVATAGNWYIRVRVTNDQNYDGRGNTNTIQMQPYDEIVMSTSNLAWGQITPPLSLTDLTKNPKSVVVKYIANGNYSKYISSTNWTGGTYSATLDADGACTVRDHFALQAVIATQPAAYVRMVDGTYVNGTLIDATGAQTLEAGDNPVATMALKTANSFDPDTYAGTMTYLIITR